MRGVRSQSVHGRIPAAALELLWILLSVKHCLRFRNMDLFFLFMLLTSKWCRKHKEKSLGAGV